MQMFLDGHLFDDAQSSSPISQERFRRRAARRFTEIWRFANRFHLLDWTFVRLHKRYNASRFPETDLCSMPLSAIMSTIKHV
jgi:hypothetical protein